MVFCAYCGQSFKRKEHLERHLPTHTNVKPYKCDSCQLSFARRDLLQKHHSTYHEVQDPSKSGNGETPVNSRTPIACINCATAKAGCDKKVPCSRCSDKNLPCAARFARRSSKGLNRSATTNDIPSLQTPVQTVQTIQPIQYGTGNNSSVGIDSETCSEVHMEGEGSLPSSHSHPDLMSWGNSHEQYIDPSQALQFSPQSFESMTKSQDPFGRGVDDILRVGGDFDTKCVDMESLNMWNNCQMDVDVNGNTGMDFSSTMSMLWFPETGESMGNTLPTPPGTSSTIHSRINSISPSWQGRVEPRLPDLAPSLLDIDNCIISELEVVIAAQDAWPLARCNPRIFSGTCPRTAIVHLQTLQNCSQLDDAWKSMNDLITPENQNIDGNLKVMPLLTTTRDKIIAFAQSFLLKALMTHHSGINGYKMGGTTTFFTLPPSNVLENLLRSSVRSLSPYYSLIHGTSLDPNDLMLDNDSSTLLFLLMMAQGASTVPKAEARYLAAGLTETCRISLFDVIEKNVELSADPIVLKSALLFTLLGAWGGDAWHIKQAMGQRGMYLSMLKHSGMLEPQVPMLSDFTDSTDMNVRWREWLRREHIYRLVYNWVMIDQELSLFHDTSPILSITDLQTPLPCSERLWRAQSSVEWLDTIQETYTNSSSPEYYSSTHPHDGLSLSHLFQDMLRDELEMKNRRLSPLRLKLLLHPLQSLVCHLGQLLSCFYGMHDNQHSTRPITTASTLMRLEEVQSSLQKWYELCMINSKADPECSITNESLILFHLISLNTVTYFPEIERLVRKEGFDGLSWESALRSKQFIYKPESAIFHCGQVLRIITNMPKGGRPPWWSAALYRVTMILWVSSISRAYSDDNREKGSVFMINSVTSDDQAVKAYVTNLVGVPALLRRDGSFTQLGNPDDVITHSLTVLDEGVATRFSDGIRRKLQTVLRNWKAT